VKIIEAFPLRAIESIPVISSAGWTRNEPKVSGDVHANDRNVSVAFIGCRQENSHRYYLNVFAKMGRKLCPLRLVAEFLPIIFGFFDRNAGWKGYITKCDDMLLSRAIFGQSVVLLHSLDIHCELIMKKATISVINMPFWPS
jgi:hypothetical protein